MTLTKAQDFFNITSSSTSEEIQKEIKRKRDIIEYAKEHKLPDWKHINNEYQQACCALMEIASNQVLNVNPEMLSASYRILGISKDSNLEKVEERYKQFINFIDAVRGTPEEKREKRQDVENAYNFIIATQKYKQEPKKEESRDFVEKVDTTIPINSNQSGLYNPNFIKITGEDNRTVKLPIYQDQDITISKIGTLKYMGNLGMVSQWIDKFEVEKLGEEIKTVYTELAVQDFRDSEFINFVKQDLLSQANINAAQIYNGGYVGHPFKNKEGTYERQYNQDALSAVIKNKLEKTDRSRSETGL